MSDAPEKIIACATRGGAFWKSAPGQQWFGEAFADVEYVSADLFRRREDALTTLLAQAQTERDEARELAEIQRSYVYWKYPKPFPWEPK